MRVLVDMDEVFVDFVGGACTLLGVEPQWLWERHIPGVWDIMPTLGISDEEFWKRVQSRGEYDFWLELSPLPWMTAMLDLVKFHTKDWYIVSTPSRSPKCYGGKAAWLKAYLGRDFDQFLITPHKHLLAQPGVVLIDDNEDNLRRFQEAGGHRITFPSLLNKLYRESEDPLTYVAQSLRNHFDILG